MSKSRNEEKRKNKWVALCVVVGSFEREYQLNMTKLLNSDINLWKIMSTTLMVDRNSQIPQPFSILYVCSLLFTCIFCHGVKYNVKSNWVAKLFSQAVTTGGEGWAATMLVNKTPLKWTHHNYCLYYPSRSRTEAPACNWLTNYPIWAWPIEIIVLVCSGDMLTESYHSLWLKQSISRCSQPTCSHWQLLVESRGWFANCLQMFI